MRIDRLVVLLMCTVHAAAAQENSLQRFQGEARVDLIAGGTTAVHAALGTNAMISNSLRLGADIGGGMRRVNGTMRASGRFDVTARFHLDPFQQFAHGVYVGGGGALYFDDGAPRRVRAVVLTGVEGTPSRHGWIGGVEFALGGGVRVGATLRRARTSGR
ncbi:MAG TPA: hypothetical protein VE967_07165 [Gemmatimonadaceae bacterium]|nr:hypothetical protein [Gemmatimonadaceae bacterium]